MEDESREYYGRIIRLKPIIEADKRILEQIALAFDSVLTYKTLPNSMLKLGRGKSHVVAGVGNIQDPLTGDNLFLALKLHHGVMYGAPISIAEQIGAYETAFETSQNPPYFIGAVKTKIIDRTCYGMIMEDISKGNTLQLIDEQGMGNTTCEVVQKGKRETRFIDPDILTAEDHARGLREL